MTDKEFNAFDYFELVPSKNLNPDLVAAICPIVYFLEQKLKTGNPEAKNWNLKLKTKIMYEKMIWFAKEDDWKALFLVYQKHKEDVNKMFWRDASGKKEYLRLKKIALQAILEYIENKN